MKQILIYIVGLLVLSTTAVKGQFTETKEFNKAYKVLPETRIEISNKYGQVEVTPWDKDSVVIKVIVELEERSLSRLRKTLNNIDIKFAHTSNYLIAQTLIGNNNSFIEKEWFRLKESVLKSSPNSTKIDYHIWVPEESPLNIEHKFGNIFMDDYKGELSIDLSNGKLKAHKLSGETRITVLFGGATIDEMTKGRINSSYGNVYIKQSGDLQITSKSSQIELLEIDDLRISSRRDNFRIRSIYHLDAESSFTDFRISKLYSNITGRFHYGDLEVAHVAPGFEEIGIQSQSADIMMDFDPKAGFNYVLTHTKSKINLQQDFHTESESLKYPDEKTYETIGYFGKTKATGDIRLSVKSVDGNISLSTY